jgi:PTS system nitrogen regulatory IIA component
MQLTVRDVSALLGVSEKTVYRWISQGHIPAYRVNAQYRFNRAELLEWATARKLPVSSEIFARTESDADQLPTLADALQAGGIFYGLRATDKASALRAVVEVLRLPEEVDRDFLFRMLLAREALESTGIGEGIAIPHVRNPIVLHVSSPMISLCFLERAIDFGALDGKPVFILFSLISPTVRIHLRLLSRLAFALQDPGFKQAVTGQAPPEKILSEARRVEILLGKNITTCERQEA